MSYAKNPSDSGEPILAFCDTVAAAADLDLTTRVDMADYEYVEVLAAMGDGDTALAITAQEVATATGGTPAAISGKSLSFAANGDQTGKVMEIRTHGRERYLNLNVTGTSGTSSVLCLWVIGHGRQYTSEYPTYGATLTQLGLS